MFATAFKYGLIAASVIVAGFILAFNVMEGDLAIAEITGWTSMAIAMVLTYLAIRSARVNGPDQRISFTDAVLVGAIMTIMATLAWVFGFEIVLGDRVATLMEGTEWAELYRQPMIRWVMSAGEILPVGLLVSLVAAFVESRRKAS